MTNRADTLCANDFQLSGSKKKKKKKKNLKERDGEKTDECVTPPFSSPFERSSSFSEPVEYQDVGDGEAHGKKSKKKKKEKKASRERLDSQSDRFSVVAESELNSDAGTPTRNKKRKQTRTPKEPDAGDVFCVPETPEVVSNPPEEHFENVARVYESTPLKKKQKHASSSLAGQAEARQASVWDTNDRTDSTTPSKREQMELSKTVDTEVDIFASPTHSRKTQRSGLSPEKETQANADLSQPKAGKKRQKHKKLHRTDASDAAGDGLAVEETVSLGLNSGQESKLSHVYEGTSFKKKKKRASALLAERASDRDTDDRADSVFPSEQDQTDVSETGETEVDIFASRTPVRKTQHSGLSPEKGNADLGRPDAGKKHKKSHRTDDSDSAFDLKSELAHVSERTPLKKKKKHVSSCLAEGASIRATNDQIDSATPGERDQMEASETGDTEMGHFASHAPSRKKQHSGLAQEKEDQVTDADLSHPHAGKKPWKRKKSHRTDDSDVACNGIAVEETVSSGLQSGQESRLAHVSERTPLKKKKKRGSVSVSEQALISDTNDRIDSAHPSERDQTDLSKTADKEMDAVASLTPSRKTQHSGLSQVKEKRADADLSCPDAGKKRQKRKKSHRTDDLDAAGDGLAVEETVSSDLKSGQGSKLTHVSERTPLKKKKKHISACLAEGASIRDTNDQIDSATPGERDQIEASETVDTEMGHFASHAPSRKKQHSDLSQEKENRVTNADLSHPHAGKKPRKRNKSHRSDDSDAARSGVAVDETVSSGLQSGQGSRLAHVSERTPLKKKKKRGSVSVAEQASISDTDDRIDSAHPSERDQTDLSEIADKEMDAVASLTPSRKTRRSDLSQAKGKRVADADLSRPDAGKKRRKRKKSHRADDSDSAGSDLKSGQGTKLATSKGSHRLRKSRLPVQTDVQDSSSTGQPAWETCSLMDDDLPESYGSAYSDLGTATKELEEFIPHVRSLTEESIQKLAYRDLARFKEFKKQGIAVKFGRFSKKENNLLKRNVEEFLNESGIDSAEKLLFTHRFPEERGAISKLKCDLLFGVKIAEGLPRPWRLVYYRARKMFDPQNYNGRYSEEEKKKLMAYQAIHGNNWKKISQLMTRSSRSVAWKYSHIKCQPNFGPWSQEENKKLVRAVEAVLRAKAKGLDSALDKEDPEQVLMVVRENLYRGIPWTQVEAEVGTRNWKQCKKKWDLIVTKRMSKGQTKSYGTENVKFKIDLIERLHKLNIEDENEINWEDFTDVIRNVTPTYVQSRFYKLKNQYVPSWRKKDFPDIIDYLYKETLPKLKSTFGKRTAKETPAAEEPKQKQAFRFSDIFQDLTSEEDED
ncbi:transcription termination factor 1 [Elgaria multicarinata webbii]|uniref:transcription termination factor 1 n=1 Tax=Elgaria multicarinata webbii TaxID=159646 RepID=UPI002FCD13E7